MNNPKITLIFVLVSTLYASDSFGGIGLAISQSQNGAKIVSVIPGTPAAETKLQANDYHCGRWRIAQGQVY